MNVKEWLWSVAIKKAVRRGALAAVAALAAFLAKPETAAMLSQIGVSVDFQKLQDGGVVLLTALAVGGFELIRNWMKHKKGVKVP